MDVALDIALVAPLLWRRRAPVVVFSLIWAAAAVQGLAERPSFSDAALLVAFYTVATPRDRRTTILIGTALELGIVLAVISRVSGADPWLKAFVALSGLATAAGVLGLNVRNRRQILAGFHERAERLEREHERDVALAKANERTRIAQEMHDVIAHNVSVMVALCDGAGSTSTTPPNGWPRRSSRRPRTGRQALAELRQTLGVLRDPPADPQLAPLPGIRQIEDLVSRSVPPACPSRTRARGELKAAPPGMELAVYRIVQEALTNTLKHAGDGARATVTVACPGRLHRDRRHRHGHRSGRSRRRTGPVCAGCASAPRSTAAV